MKLNLKTGIHPIYNEFFITFIPECFSPKETSNSTIFINCIRIYIYANSFTFLCN